MKRIFFILSLAVILSGIFAANLVFAADPAPADNKPKCQLKSETGEAIPSSFSVGDCLVAPGQEGSKFVPQKEGNIGSDGAGSSPAGQASENKNTVVSFLVEAIDLLVKLIASLALIVFILGALLTITSEGKEDRLEKGKTAMFYALIGLVIAGFSFIIVTFVQSVLF